MHVQSNIEPFAKQQNNAQNMPHITKSRQHHKILVSPGFLLKIRPNSAQIFTKMRPDELVTLSSNKSNLVIKAKEVKFVQEAIACDVSSVVMFIKGLAKSLIYIRTFPGTFNSFIKKSARQIWFKGCLELF